MSKNEPQTEVALFAGGCFWCTQHDFDHIDGVISTTAGYTGGEKNNPTYDEVSSGTTGHAEALQVVYDPKKVSYSQLLDIYWHSIDPTTRDGQFCDLGTQYRPIIFYLNDEQKRLAVESKNKIIQSKQVGKVVVDILAASKFYPAEEYHQTFYEKNPAHYQSYRQGSARDKKLREIWGDRK